MTAADLEARTGRARMPVSNRLDGRLALEPPLFGACSTSSSRAKT
jgi:hypothetical protein